MAERVLSVDEVINLLVGRTSDEVIDLLADKSKKRKETALAPRNCLNCDSRFIPRQKGQIYCGGRCRTLARRKRRNENEILDLDQRFCEWCGNLLPSEKRSHAKYCSTKCRQEAAGALVCVYCGEIADTKDHFIPRAFVKRVRELGWHDPSTFLLVPACKECNSTAGSEVFALLKDKRNYIHNCYKRRYKKILEMPDWTQSELNELGPTLKSSVLQGINAKKRLKARLRWKSY